MLVTQFSPPYSSVEVVCRLLESTGRNNPCERGTTRLFLANVDAMSHLRTELQLTKRTNE